MRKLRSIFTLGIAACCMTLHARSTSIADNNQNQGNEQYKFIQLQGGVGTTFTDVNFTQLMSPTASIGIGSYFHPIGARFHVNAWESKGGFTSIPDTYKFNYINTNFDLLANLTAFFTKESCKTFNLYLVGGIGLNYAWNNNDLSTILSSQSPLENTTNVWGSGKTHEYILGHVFRTGIMADLSLSPNWTLGLEVDINSLSDRFNSKYSNSDDWMLTVQLGATYKFGHKKAKSVVPAIATTPAIQEKEETAPIIVEEKKEEIIPEPTPVVEEKPIIEIQPLNESLHYAIRDSKISSMAVIEKVAEWAKASPDKKIIVSGYADKETGNATINMKYSQERVDRVVEALKAKGVPASQIEAKAYGDTIQPYTENDKNRCVIIIGK